MPEMPEVETIKKSLLPNVVNKKIDNVEVLLDRMIKFPTAEMFKRLLNGATITDLKRTGKYLRFVLQSGDELIVHLRMTGQLIYCANVKNDVKYARIIFSFSDGTSLVYADLRTLGAIYVVNEQEKTNIKGLVEMGPEPLSDEFTLSYLTDALKKKKTKLKSLLLNQSFIGGLGNIYADEALFLANIHPQKIGAELDKAQINRLYKAVNKVIADGIADGGTTFRDYRDGNGEKGSHQEKLFVYQRTGKPCQKCGTAIERLVIGGRSSHFCPKCQPLK